MSDERKAFLLLTGMCVCAALVMGGLLWMEIMPCNDAMARYAPMARAFAEGDFLYAFHPHTGVLFSTLSGVIAFCTGLEGFRACQYAALVLWVLSAFPLYAVAVRIWKDRAVALTTVFLYFLCSHMQRFVYLGVRDNGRSLGFFLLVLGLLTFYEDRKSWRSVFAVAGGGAILTMLRADGFFFAVAGLAVLLVLDVTANGMKWVRSALCGVLFLLLLLPQLYLNVRWNGYMVPSSRHALLLEKMGVPPIGSPYGSDGRGK
ncbi:MAG: hypothetical protein J6A21_07665 [Lentisphaeria bacterium]|nr:hypothetical protein [Lentisphaeria bacterium]